jgi:hypothetical protein
MVQCYGLVLGFDVKYGVPFLRLLVEWNTKKKDKKSGVRRGWLAVLLRAGLLLLFGFLVVV